MSKQTPPKYRWMDLIYSEDGPEDPKDRLLLSAIAKCMNPDGTGSRPTHARLAMMCGWKKRQTVLARLKRLEGIWVGVLKACGEPTYYLPRFPTENGHPRVRCIGDTPCPLPGDTSSPSPNTPPQMRRRRSVGRAVTQLPLGRQGSSLEVITGSVDETVRNLMRRREAILAKRKVDEAREGSG